MRKNNNAKRKRICNVLLEFLRDPIFMIALVTAIINTITLVNKIMR